MTDSADPRAVVRSRYAAFVSYSHADERMAGWLHRRLESYSVPGPLVGRETGAGVLGKRIGKVFRDRADLSAAHDLAGEIRDALAQSDALIVLCSPHSAQSRYVAEEIRTFKALGRGQRIFAAIIGGEPHAAGRPGFTEADECFPRAMLFQLTPDGEIGAAAEPNEPIAADLREGRDGRENGSLKLIAGLLDVGLDELVQRERQAERARRRRANMIAGAMAVLAVGAGVAGLIAVQQRGVAVSNFDLAKKEEKRALKGEQDAREAQALAEHTAIEREQQRDRARNALALALADGAWEAIGENDPARAARLALLGARIAPGNTAEYRAALARLAFDSRYFLRAGRAEANVTAAAFSEGRLLLGLANGSVLAIDPASGRTEALARLSGKVLDLKATPDGAILAVSAAGGTAQFTSVSEGRVLASVAGEENVVCGRVGGRELGFVIGRNMRVEAYGPDGARRGEGRQGLLALPEERCEAVFHPDGAVSLPLMGEDGVSRTASVRHVTAAGNATTRGDGLNGRDGVTIFLQPLAGAQQSVVAATGVTMVKYDFGSGETALTVRLPRNLSHLRTSPDGKLAVSVGRGGLLQVWSMTDGRMLGMRSGFPPLYGRIHFLAGDRVAAIDGNRRAAVYVATEPTLRSGAQLSEIANITGPERALRYGVMTSTADGNLLLTASEREWRLWRMPSSMANRAQSRCRGGNANSGQANGPWRIQRRGGAPLQLSRDDFTMTVRDVATGRALHAYEFYSLRIDGVQLMGSEVHLCTRISSVVNNLGLITDIDGLDRSLPELKAIVCRRFLGGGRDRLTREEQADPAIVELAPDIASQPGLCAA